MQKTQTNQPLPLLVEGDIVVPYRSGYPIMLFDNEAQEDTFIRARKHPVLGIWYSNVDEEAEDLVAKPRAPQHWRAQGAVIFTPVQKLRANQGILVSRTFRGGLSARGTVIELPEGIKYPYDVDTKKLFKPLK
jgi:hypothetical protein